MVDDRWSEKARRQLLNEVEGAQGLKLREHGLNQLRLVMGQLMRGEVGMRVMV